MLEVIIVQQADLAFQKEQFEKITKILYARILTEKDKQFKVAIEDVIEEHVKQSV